MIFNVTLPSDGTNANVADYNDPILQILAGLNGQLNDDNISSLSGSKITPGTLPEAALASSLKTGWFSAAAAPTAVTYLGQRSYQLTYASSILGYKSVGMRSKHVRTASAPTQCTSLNGTNQYYVKSSPNKMTWTDDFSVGAWIKPSAFGADMTVVSRYNGTSGWTLRVDSNGVVMFIGYNGGSGNNRYIITTQTLPLNKWTHVSAQLDMSAFTNTSTTSYVMYDGIDIPGTMVSNGTNPTSLVQAGNLEIGARNTGTEPFSGKIAQVAIFNAKVTQATWRTYQSQGLAGNETSLASAYSFNNSIADLNATTPNDLSAQNSAAATNADSPFGDYGVSATDEFCITTAISSDGLTETVQVPEGSALPTSGGIASTSYSSQKTPFKFPLATERWTILTILNQSASSIATSYGTTVNPSTLNTWVPVGVWDLRAQLSPNQAASSASGFFVRGGISTSASAVNDQELMHYMYNRTSSTSSQTAPLSLIKPGIVVTTGTPYYWVITSESGAGTPTLNWAVGSGGSRVIAFTRFTLSYL